MIAQAVCFALDTLLWTGLLAALVLAVRRPVARWFGPGVAYALWLLPLLRMILPPLVLPWARPERFAPVATNPVPEAAGADTVVTTVSLHSEPVLALPWDLLLGSVWLGGAALFLVLRWRDYRAMQARLLAEAVEVDRREGVRLVETPAVGAPVAFGLRDKVIALPPRFLISGSLEGRALAIEHELAHHRGRDLLANWLAQPLLALHWFNPLAWMAWSAMRRDQEAACDARALAGSDPARRAAYARVIAEFAAGDRLGTRTALAAPMACPVLGDKSIVHRLRSLTMTDISPRRRRAGRWALAAGAALALPLTATVVYAGQDAPQAPAAPAAPNAPSAPRIEKRVMIVEHADHADHAAADKDGEHKMFEKRIERDGKTVVIRSPEPIDEARLEEKLGKLGDLDKDLGDLGDLAPGKPGERRVVRKIVMHDGDAERHHAAAMAMQGCEEGKALAEADASRETGDAAKKAVKRTHIMLCGRPGLAKAEAVAKVRAARERIAASAEMDAGIRADILRQLDTTIARLEHDAG